MPAATNIFASLQRGEKCSRWSAGCCSSLRMAKDAQRALLLLGGVMSLAPHDLADSYSIVVCADSGAEHARSLGLRPHSIVGDLDSVSRETLTYFQSLGVQIHPVQSQDTDDFEKALAHLRSFHQGEVTVLGLTGLRTDHKIGRASCRERVEI